MYISFEKLPNNARIWIYQADRLLIEAETLAIDVFLKESIEQWSSHGESLKGGFMITENRFLVIGVDVNYNNASGCSIDASSRWIKELNANLNIDFFDRSLAYFKNNELAFLPILSIKKYIELGELSPNTLIYNHQITTKNDLANSWKIAASNSFLKRYFEPAVTF